MKISIILSLALLVSSAIASEVLADTFEAYVRNPMEEETSTTAVKTTEAPRANRMALESACFFGC